MMDFTELLKTLNLEDKEILVTIINPVRKDPIYKTGILIGFKYGIFGGGWYNYKNGEPRSFESSRMRFIKKPKVCVSYGVYQIFPKAKSYSDWIDIDNCVFEIKQNC